MIKNLIFDFGDVFLDLDKTGAMNNALNLFQIDALTDEMIDINCQFEKGLISSHEFANFYTQKFPYLSYHDLVDIWNFVLVEFPQYKMDFLSELNSSNKYNLVLLSNTNEIHIDWVKENVPFYNEFKNSFDRFYLSHEINLRKPDSEIFEFVLDENDYQASETLFIDDTKDNTDAASQMGIHVWNIDETKQDIVDLFTIKKELF